jgi:hypothetical protein
MGSACSGNKDSQPVLEEVKQVKADIGPLARKVRSSPVVYLSQPAAELKQEKRNKKLVDVKAELQKSKTILSINNFRGLSEKLEP